MESNPEQPLKTSPMIGYALSAELLSLTFHPATNIFVAEIGDEEGTPCLVLFLG
jgi:hypothetical protein